MVRDQESFDGFGYTSGLRVAAKLLAVLARLEATSKST